LKCYADSAYLIDFRAGRSFWRTTNLNIAYVLLIFSRPFRLHPLHLCSLVRRFSGSVRKFATRAARLVTVLTENPPARHTEFSLGTMELPARFAGLAGGLSVVLMRESAATTTGPSAAAIAAQGRSPSSRASLTLSLRPPISFPSRAAMPSLPPRHWAFPRTQNREHGLFPDQWQYECYQSERNSAVKSASVV